MFGVLERVRALGVASVRRHVLKAYRFVVNRKLLGHLLKDDVDTEQLELDIRRGRAVLKDLDFRTEVGRG